MSIIKRKTLRYILALFIIFSLNFFIPRLMPGDPVHYLLGAEGTVDPDTVEELKKELGLHRPLLLQYLHYWSRLLRFDLGYSFHLKQPVSRIILDRAPWTLGLLLPPIFLGALLGAFLGALSAWHSGSRGSKMGTAAVVCFYSLPPYFLAMPLLYLFAVHWELLPLKGFYQSGAFADILRHYVLPVSVLTLFIASRNYMIMRGSVLLEKDKPYVWYARAKGLSGSAVLFRHIFKNALLPVITMISLDFGFIFSGALLIEIVFSMNGMGTLIYETLLSRDYPLLQGIFLVITLMVIAANILADFLYTWLDPRLKAA